MKTSNLLRVLCVLVTSVVLICIPESSFAAGGHGGGGGGFHGGGGGGFHGGGGGGFHGGGGGFHGGGFGGGFHGGGFHGGWGGSGWHGGWGWRGGWGGYGWGRGWGWGYPGWGWGVGVGWGWGSYWGGYPYAYGYPYYPYYPYDPYSSYGDPNAYAPANPDRYNGANRDPRYNSQRQNSSYPAPQRSPGINNTTPRTTFVSHKPAVDTNSAKYWLSNYQQHTVPRQAIRNVSQALLAMPPEARQRQIESGQYRNFSPAEQKLLSQVAQVSPRAEPQSNADRTKPSAFRLASQQAQ